MTTLAQAAVYDDLVEMLADATDPQRVLDFRLSPEKQSRLDDLLEKNRQETLSVSEADELNEFTRIEHVVRMLKARVRQKQQQ